MARDNVRGQVFKTLRDINIGARVYRKLLNDTKGTPISVEEMKKFIELLNQTASKLNEVATTLATPV